MAVRLLVTGVPSFNAQNDILERVHLGTGLAIPTVLLRVHGMK